MFIFIGGLQFWFCPGPQKTQGRPCCYPAVQRGAKCGGHSGGCTHCFANGAALPMSLYKSTGTTRGPPRLCCRAGTPRGDSGGGFAGAGRSAELFRRWDCTGTEGGAHPHVRGTGARHHEGGTPEPVRAPCRGHRAWWVVLLSSGKGARVAHL